MLLLALVSSALATSLLVPARQRLPAAGPGFAQPSAVRGSHGSQLVRILATLAAASGSVVLLGWPVGVAVAIPAAAGGWWAMGRMEPPAARRRREQLAASVPHVVDLMAACLAVGLSPDAAVEQITAAVDPPISDELAALAARLRLGVDPVTVWRDLAGHPQLGGLGRSIARAVDSGASVSEAMQRLAEVGVSPEDQGAAFDTLTERVRLLARRRAGDDLIHLVGVLQGAGRQRRIESCGLATTARMLSA